MARLGNICEIAAGQGAPQGENSYCNCNEGIPFIKAGDLSDLLSGKLETEIQCVNEFVAKQHKLKLYPAGSILFAKSGMSCMKGYVYRTKNPCYIVSHLAIVIPQGIDGEYLKYYFQHNKPNALIKDSAYPSISLQDISNIELTVPSLDIQASIASELNKVNMLISFRKQQLSKLDELVKSRFIEMFGDPVLNPNSFTEGIVSDYCKMTQGTQIPMSEQVGEFRDGYYRYLYIRDLKYNDGNWIYVQDKYDDKKLTEKDLVVVNTGNTAGEIYYGKDGILSNNLFKVSFDTGVLNTTYMFAYFSSQQFQSMLWNEMKEGTQPHLGHKIFGSKKLIVPPMDLQKQFAAFVEQTDKSKFEIQKSLEKLETLKKALMQKYFG